MAVTVFSAANHRTVTGPLTFLPYDVILVDTRSGFDANRSTYTVPETGFYLLAMSVGIPANQMSNYSLHGAVSVPNVLLTHTSFDGELVTSREDLQYLVEGQRLYTSSQYDVYSDDMLQTTLSGFKVSDVMNSQGIYFRVSSTNSQINASEAMPLEKLVINYGGGWDHRQHYFTAPRSGIYYFGFSSASLPNTVHDVWLLVNGEIEARSFIAGNLFPGTDTSSQSILLWLEVGDIVQLYNGFGNVYSDHNYQMSLQGFLYEPVHRVKVAWTLGFPFFQETYLYGPLSNVNFTEVILNQGLAWNKESATLTIPVSGIYYLKLSGYSWPAEYPFSMVLSVNDKPLMNVVENIDIIRVNANLRNRALICELQRGDVLKVGIPDGYNVAGWASDTMFSGFLIKPSTSK